MKISDSEAESSQQKKSDQLKFLFYLEDCRDQLEVDQVDSSISADKNINIVECKSKYRMGSLLSSLIQITNPDMILGHELVGVHLPSILEILADEHQLKFPKINTMDIKRSLRMAIKYRIKSLFTGRLLCDTFGLSKENLRIDDYE